VLKAPCACGLFYAERVGAGGAGKTVRELTPLEDAMCSWSKQALVYPVGPYIADLRLTIAALRAEQAYLLTAMYL